MVDSGCTARHIVGFKENVLGGALVRYVDLSKNIGGVVASQAAAVEKCFEALYAFVIAGSKCTKPNDENDLISMLTPLGAEMGNVGAVAGELSPNDPLFNHVTAIAESIASLAWVQLDTKPVAHISESMMVGEAFLVKILMTYKNSEQAALHRDWVNAVRAVFEDLKKYVKEYHTTSFIWNAGVVDRGSSTTSGAEVAESDDAEGSGDSADAAFQSIVDNQLAAYLNASLTLGSDIGKQAEDFASAWRKEGEFLKKSAAMMKPSDEEFQAMLQPIAEEMTKVSDGASSISSRDPHFNHLTAIAESVPVLGWVGVPSKNIAFISDTEGAGDFYLNKLLMQKKKESDFEDHQTWVKSVRELFGALKGFVKEYHTPTLSWNSATQKPKAKAAQKANLSQSSSVSDFETIINNAVIPFVELGRNIGGLVAEQAECFLKAFHEEHEFLKKASAQTKPADDIVQGMLTPIGAQIGAAQEIQAKVPPRDQVFNHVTAVGESIAALGWVAVPSKPVPYVADMEAASEFYLTKIIMACKKLETGAIHTEWVNALRKVFSDLKAFIKEHHTVSLQWNTDRSAASKMAANDEDTEDSTNDALSDLLDLIQGPVKQYEDASSKLGGMVAEQAMDLSSSIKAMFRVVAEAASKPKPSSEEFAKTITPLSQEMGKVVEIASSCDPRDEFFNHLTAIAESVPALGWLAVESKPVSYIADMAGAGEFYLNKVLVTAKGSSNVGDHRQWVNAVKEIFTSMQKYVKTHHTISLTFNSGVKPPSSIPF
eukprot:CAMPEP_0184683780 /NCGR_PEP_ID=MMETSP0312-20130426/12554_1 /TAXON_ID=31354 /ORGANISM="Compsopogon coeruleus, Strain SAG 36.94" /LENGTH=768 /DNA_ID=CAMNT_0027136385 /DNA_START=131 /DNA_END=2437 /DNA_ORIENTATION=-